MLLPLFLNARILLLSAVSLRAKFLAPTPHCPNPDNWFCPHAMWTPPWLTGQPSCEFAPAPSHPGSRFQQLALHPGDAAPFPPNLQSGSLLIVACLLSILTVLIKHAASTATQPHQSAFAPCALASIGSSHLWCCSLRLLGCWHATVATMNLGRSPRLNRHAVYL